MENSMEIKRQLFLLHYLALACNNAKRTKVCYTRYQWNNSKIEPYNSRYNPRYYKRQSYKNAKHSTKFSDLLYLFR